MKFRHVIYLTLLSSLCFSEEVFAPGSDNYNDFNDQDRYAVPPPQYPDQAGSMTFFAGVSYILWKPYQQGMMLCNANVPNNDNVTSWLRTNMQLQSGFKVAAGANTFYDGWKVQGEYTWFYNDPGMRSSVLDEYISFFTPWTDITDNLVAEARSRFANYFSRFTLSVDRTAFLGHYFSMSPWLGLIGAWETQEFNMKLTPKSPNTSYPKQLVDQRMEWWAIGPYMGFESNYFMTNEWAMHFKTGGSLNLATHKTHKSDIRTTIPHTIQTNTKNKIFDVEPMLETLLGVKWTSQSRVWGIRAFAGWELQVWFSHQSFIQPHGNTHYKNSFNQGTYSMQGLTTSLDILL